MADLAVYLCDGFVGILSCGSQGRFSFQYDRQWLENDNPPPLSLSLPPQQDPYPDEKARPFFTNLLPESRIREAAARKLGISARNDFALLEALGGECAGAVTLLPPGVPIGQQGEYQALTDPALRKII